ncbi:MAG: hypothetical protein JWL73_33 [Actinomycetia bacterium]|nr:hypothetical protein [Actinomycetes bacterium]
MIEPDDRGYVAPGLSTDVDLLEVERELCRLPEVDAARLVAGEHGRLLEVHILAGTGKTPKQIVRDVQSVAIASFGLEVDRRIVSVVQLGDDREPRLPPVGFRPQIDAITAENTGLRSLVRVNLRHEGLDAVGFAEGSVASASRHRLVAVATLDALRQLDPHAECLDLDSAVVVRVNGHDVAVVTVTYVVPPSELVVSGSAVVRGHQDSDAVARAVLDATNRHLPAL